MDSSIYKQLIYCQLIFNQIISNLVAAQIDQRLLQATIDEEGDH